MPDPITWYILPKTAIDPTTIEEQIDGDILVHNVDPSAHGQDGEAVYEHRSDSDLDHPAYSIYNIKNSPADRVFKAVVGGTEIGAFINVKEAIEYTNLHGGGTISIKAGVYFILSDLTLYSNIELLGEDDETSILDFNSAGAEVIAKGTAGTHLNNIRIRHVQFRNHEPVVDSGDILFDFEYLDDSEVQNCRFVDIQNSEEQDKVANLSNCKRVRFKDNRFEAPGDYGIYFEATCSYCEVDSNFFTGAWIQSCVAMLGEHCTITENTGESVNGPVVEVIGDHNTIIGNTSKDCDIQAIYCSGDHNTIVGNSVDAVAETSSGIDINNGSYNTIVGNTINGYSGVGGEGVMVRGNSDSNTIVGNTIYDCETGVEINANTCNNNVVVSNAIPNCTIDVDDSGVGTEEAHNTS